jgi:hypothetical protein
MIAAAVAATMLIAGATLLSRVARRLAHSVSASHNLQSSKLR